MMSFRNVLAPSVLMPEAKAAAAKALELDAHLAEPQVSLAYAAFTYDRDWIAAARYFDQALVVNPSYVLNHAFYPLYLSSCARLEESISIARHALELDPVGPAGSHVLAVQLYLARQYDSALAQCDQTLEMDPNYEAAYAVQGQVHVATGLLREAIIDLEKNLALTHRSPWALALLGYAQARMGETAQALAVIEELAATSQNAFVPAPCSALVYTGLEEKDEAFAWLEKSFNERNSRLAYLRVEVLWDPIRSDPRFEQLLQRTSFALH